MKETRQTLWTDLAWLAEVNDWLKAALRQQGMEITAAPEQIHIQPWSTVLRVPTDAGNVYFKATAPGLAQETAVTQALYQWQPDCIPQVLRADIERGWMLLADGGQRLRERFKAGLALSAWMEILAEYSEADLLAAYQIARRLWAISSAIKYKTFMSLIGAARKENAMAVPALLQELLAANPTW